MEDFNPCGTAENVIKYHVENNERRIRAGQKPFIKWELSFLP